MPSAKDLSKGSNKAGKSGKASVVKTKKKSANTPAPQSAKSTEYVEDSGSEDAGSEEVPQQRTANGATSKVRNASSTSSSEDESEDAGVENNGDDDEGSDDEEDVIKAAGTGLVERSASKVAKMPATKTVIFTKAPQFVPPRGFEARHVEVGSARASKLLKKSNMEDKQIWYITAPASVPMSTLKEVSLNTIQDGGAVCSHDGNDYSFLQDTEDKTYTRIMVPDASEDGYRTCKSAVEQVLHLRQVVKLPAIRTDEIQGSEVSSRATVPAKKPVRQQPKGLRMRFTPIGYGNGDPGIIGLDGDSDVEMEDAAPTPRRTESTKLGDDTATATVTDEKPSKRKYTDGEKRKDRKDKKSKTSSKSS